jgi:hypothetical protein
MTRADHLLERTVIYEGFLPRNGRPPGDFGELVLCCGHPAPAGARVHSVARCERCAQIPHSVTNPAALDEIHLRRQSATLTAAAVRK